MPTKSEERWNKDGNNLKAKLCLLYTSGYRSGLLRRKLGTVADWCALDCDRIAGRAGRYRADLGPASA